MNQALNDHEKPTLLRTSSADFILQKNESDVVVSNTVLAEYPDWYTVKAPIDH